VDETKHYQTAPEDRVSLAQKIAYGIGSFVNNLLGAAIGTMAIVLNLGLGMNPAIVGMLMSLPRLVDAFIDPVMGYISDHTRSRFGRRRPYIFLGAIFSGVVFALMWQIQPGHTEHYYFWFFIFAWTLFYIAYTVYAAPWVGLGYEMTPDYHERTRLMGYSNWIGQFAWVAAPWFYKIMENKAWFPDSVTGARKLAIVVGAIVVIFGIVPALVCREKGQPQPAAPAEGAKGAVKTLWNNSKQFFKGFGVTFQNSDFRRLCTATFLVFNGFMLVSAFSSYIIIYYVFKGNQDQGATYMGWFGLVSSIATFCVIPLVTWISSKVGKRRAFLISTGLSIVGYALKAACYSQTTPWIVILPAPLIAFGLGGLFTLMGSMIADVCDMDELKTGNRREATYGAIYWWMVKLGMALAFAISGHLLNYTGFKVELGSLQSTQTLFLMRVFDIGVPIIASFIAIFTMRGYQITEEKAHKIRYQLEKRRGKWNDECCEGSAVPETV